MLSILFIKQASKRPCRVIFKHGSISNYKSPFQDVNSEAQRDSVICLQIWMYSMAAKLELKRQPAHYLATKPILSSKPPHLCCLSFYLYLFHSSPSLICKWTFLEIYASYIHLPSSVVPSLLHLPLTQTTRPSGWASWKKHKIEIYP